MAESTPVWLRAAEGGSVLRIHAQPGAAKSGIAGPHGDALKVRVAAPAVEGAANCALVEFLAEWLELSRREVTIKSGEKSRRKTFWVAATPEEIQRRLNKDRA